MNAWASIQRTLDYIEAHIADEIQIEKLAGIAHLSLFYYHRLFTRLVKKPVREYAKLRRLARACRSLADKGNRILDVALEYGFGSHETFTRAFKGAYGLTPSEYRNNPVSLSHFDKPDLLLGLAAIDEGAPLVSDGLVLEINRKTLGEPVRFLGVSEQIRFEMGKMLGERPGVSAPGEVWGRLFKSIRGIPRVPGGRMLGVCYRGDAPEGHATYFAGAEVGQAAESRGFASWQMPAREYVVCAFEAESFGRLTDSLGKAMKFTRFWLKKRGLAADGFFPEIYYQNSPELAYMELWVPFRPRENRAAAGLSENFP